MPKASAKSSSGSKAGSKAASKRASKTGSRSGKASGKKAATKGEKVKGSGSKRSSARKGSPKEGRAAESRPSGGRPIWSGTLAFGLVTLPVELYPTTRSGGVSLRMIGPEGKPLKRRYYCERDGELLTRDEIVRGYPIDGDKFVVIEDEELEALDPDSSRVIDLDVFVPEDQLDPSYVANTYVLVPGRDAATAYRLLVRSMGEEGRAGIATFVMRGRSYLMAIVSREGTLRGLTLRYADEVRSPEDVGLPELETADVDAVESIVGAAKELFEEGLDARELEDEGARLLTALAERKLKRGEDVHARAPEDEEEDVDEELEATLVDVMELLRKSLGKAARA